MRQRASNILGFFIVICFLLSLSGCVVGGQPIKPIEPTKENAQIIGRRVALGVGLISAFKPEYGVIADIVCEAQQGISAGKLINVAELFTDIKLDGKELTDRQQWLADSILSEVILEFEKRSIPLKNESVEYGRFVFAVLGEACLKLAPLAQTR